MDLLTYLLTYLFLKIWGGQFALAFPTPNIIRYTRPPVLPVITPLQPVGGRHVRPHHLAPLLAPLFGPSPGLEINADRSP